MIIELLVTTIAHTIQIAVAPVFLLTGVGAFFIGADQPFRSYYR